MQGAKVLENMTGHMTKEEIEERERRQNAFTRDEVMIEMPDYLNDDFIGQLTWNRVLEDAQEFKIFDNLDREVLGTFCCITSRIVDLRKKYRSAVKGHRKNTEILGISKELRFQESLQLTYAGKLGLTPEARVRLAQKIVEPDEDQDDDFFG